VTKLTGLLDLLENKSVIICCSVINHKTMSYRLLFFTQHIVMSTSLKVCLMNYVKRLHKIL